MPAGQDVQFCSSKIERKLEGEQLQHGPRGSAERPAKNYGRRRIDKQAKPKTTETRHKEVIDKTDKLKIIYSSSMLFMLLRSF